MLGFANLVADGFSMSVGAYLSDLSRSKNASRRRSVGVGVATFVSFFVVGLIPLLPYLFLQGMVQEGSIFFITCLATILTFGCIGYVKSSLEKGGFARGIFETVILGVIAALIAYFLGDVLVRFFTEL